MKLSKAMAAKVLKMAGGGKPRKPPPAKLCAGNPAAVRWSFTVSVPTTVVSEANRREHWAKKLRRKDGQRHALCEALAACPVKPSLVQFPVTVTWVRIGRQRMDDDNLANAFKGLRDELAHLMGIDDGSPQVAWRYEQRTGDPDVEVRIESGIVPEAREPAFVPAWDGDYEDA